MKTFVYVDGFNLYYAVLKGSTNKWLDLRRLFSTVLQPHHEILSIKYFTARVSARSSQDGSPTRQDTYLRAIRAHDPTIQVIEGHYLSHTVRAKLDPPLGNVRFADVVKTEEKGSDVNLAVHLLDDAWRNHYECAVVVSNDSDLSESLRLVKAQDRSKTIIVLTPGEPRLRRTSNQLARWANAKRNIYGPVLTNSQLPDSVVSGTQTIRKPAGW